MGRSAFVFLALWAASVSACCGSSESSGGQRGDSVKATPENTATAPKATSQATQRASSPQATAPSDPPAVEGKVSPVHFEKGASSASIKGGMARGERVNYSLGAKQGQTMTLSISSVEDNAVFSVQSPDGKIIPGTEEERDLKRWTGVLPQSGRYIVTVGATRGGASFTLDIAIN